MRDLKQDGNDDDIIKANCLAIKINSVRQNASKFPLCF